MFFPSFFFKIKTAKVVPKQKKDINLNNQLKIKVFKDNIVAFEFYL